MAYPEQENPQGSPAWMGRAFRRTAAWQLMGSFFLAIPAAFFAGLHGFISAMLGGSVGIVGLLVFVLVTARARSASRSVVRTALRAEAAKMLVIVLLLLLIFAVYRDRGMVVLAFMGAFAVSVLLSGLVFAVSGNRLTSNSL